MFSRSRFGRASRMPVNPPSAPNTPNAGENTGIKTATVGDEVYRPSKFQSPATTSSASYVPGPGGEKFPISSDNRGVTPLPGPSLIGMPEITPEAIAASKARGAIKRQMNPPGMYTPPPGIEMPRMRTPVAPLTEAQMMKKGGKVKGYAKGGSVRGDGICQRGKTKGTMR